jgi:hypothetical protein
MQILMKKTLRESKRTDELGMDSFENSDELAD